MSIALRTSGRLSVSTRTPPLRSVSSLPSLTRPPRWRSSAAFASSRRHPLRAVEPDGLAVEHGVVDDASASCANSSAWPRRRGCGICAASPAFTSSPKRLRIGVSNTPGAMVATRIARCARSRAALSVIPTMPALDAAYGSWPICPSQAAIEAVSTKTPRSPSSGSLRAIADAANRSTLYVPMTLTRSTVSNSSRSPGLPSFCRHPDGAAPARAVHDRPQRCAAGRGRHGRGDRAGVGHVGRGEDRRAAELGGPLRPRTRAGRRSPPGRRAWPAAARMAQPRPDAPPVTRTRCSGEVHQESTLSVNEDQPRRSRISGVRHAPGLAHCLQAVTPAGGFQVVRAAS